METTQAVRLRWQREMCRERTSMVKLAGGFTHIYLKDMSKLASWPDFSGACMEREMQRQFGETLVRTFEGWFHQGRNRVPRFLLQSRRRSQRIVSW